jgi:hypothetical protein
VVGVKNFGFRMEDLSSGVNEGELCVNTSWLGMLAERHWRNPSSDEAAAAWAEDDAMEAA